MGADGGAGAGGVAAVGFAKLQERSQLRFLLDRISSKKWRTMGVVCEAVGFS